MLHESDLFFGLGKKYRMLNEEL